MDRERERERQQLLCQSFSFALSFVCFGENGEGERWRRFTVDRECLVCFSPERRVPNGTLVRVKPKNRIHKPATVHCATLICDAERHSQKEKNCTKNSVPAPPPLSVSLFSLLPQPWSLCAFLSVCGRITASSLALPPLLFLSISLSEEAEVSCLQAFAPPLPSSASPRPLWHNAVGSAHSTITEP